MHRASSLILAFVASCTLELAGEATPATGWPDLAAPPVGRRDGHEDAALIIAIDESTPGGRAGAFEVASGWWRYLVETRGLRRVRVQLLRDEQATAANIRAGVERLEERAGTGSMLWLIFIGSASSPMLGGDGQLHAADGEHIDFAPLRDALSAGLHESAFMLIDACDEQPGSARLAGLQAVTGLEHEITAQAWQQLSERTYYMGARPDDPSGMLSTLAGVHGRVEDVLRRESATVRNSFVITAGVGSGCAATLADRPWPTLAYAGLGALQGWADRNADGHVSATELSIYAQSVAAALDEQQPADAELPRIRAGGVDIVLADVHDRWSARAQRLAPAALSQTPTSLARAATIVDLRVEDMVPVAAGEFTLGCASARGPRRSRTSECEADESPSRALELGGYAIDRTEVTWADYRKCIDAGVCPPLLLHACWVWTGRAFERGAELPAELFADDHPVMCVNWVEAMMYCKAAGKRLPTEAEWERAARGLDGRSYPWGNDAPTCRHAVMSGCAGHPRAVGSRPEGESPVGALDMSGNVSEWVNDWWSANAYAKLTRVDPSGPHDGEVRVVRGGSFYDGADTLRAGYRYGIEPLARLSTVGFRCAR